MEAYNVRNGSTTWPCAYYKQSIKNVIREQEKVCKQDVHLLPPLNIKKAFCILIPQLQNICLHLYSQGAPFNILLTGGPRDIFGSEILVKREFSGSMKDAGIFWVAKNTQGHFWV